MTLQETIKEAIKDAMRAKDAVKLDTLRGLSAAMANESVTLGRTPQDPLSDEEALAVVRRASKQRKDAIAQFEGAGRPELAADEKAQLAVVETFLPQMMSRDEIRPLAAVKAAEIGATTKDQAGALMKALMADLKGKADGGDVKAVVEEILA
jgi:uncharacterized protein YqeY